MMRPPGHLITGAGREKVKRKGGGEEARSVRCMCDVCAAHGDRTAVGVDVDAQGSGLREDGTHFLHNARVERRAFVSPHLTRSFRRMLLGRESSRRKRAITSCIWCCIHVPDVATLGTTRSVPGLGRPNGLMHLTRTLRTLMIKIFD